MNSSCRRRVFHAVFQCAIYSRHRQRCIVGPEPGLLLRKGQQRHDGTRRHQIVARQSRSVRLNYVARFDSCSRVKICWNFHQIVRSGPNAALARHGPEQHFCVQVLADFVDELQRVTQRHRNVFRQHNWITAGFRMIVPRSRSPCDFHSTFLQQPLQRGCSMLRGLFNRQNQFPWRTLRRQGAPHDDQIRSRLALERQIRFHVRGGSGHLISNQKIRRRGTDRRLYRIARLFTRGKCQRYGVVIQDDRGNGRAVLPHHVVNFPAIRIAFPWKVTVIAYHVS